MGSILVQSCQMDSTQSPLLALTLSGSSIFDADFSQLFQEQQLSLIHSKYFSTRGPRTENLNAHPVQNALFQSLEVDDVKKGLFPEEDVSSTVTSLALQSYFTSFKNM